MTFVTEEDEILALIQGHMSGLYRQRRDILLRHRQSHMTDPDLEVLVPSGWPQKRSGYLGTLFGLPMYTAEVAEPAVRIAPERSSREKLLEERLAQRTKAMARVAAENDRLREAVSAVLALAASGPNPSATVLTGEEVQDALGGELIAELRIPTVPSAVPRDLMSIQSRVNAAFTRRGW